MVLAKRYGVLTFLNGKIMVEYGYINENGYLVSKQICEYTEKYKDNNGNDCIKVITIDMQIPELLSNGWKQVDPVDESRRICDVGFFVRITPFDNGDRISYNYIQKVDVKMYKTEIDKNKKILSDSDYKVSKCYEASLLGEPLPYDINELHTMRQAARDKVNELEGVLYGLDK